MRPNNRSIKLGRRTVAIEWCEVRHADPKRLTVAERVLYERGKTPKRRAEFCAGRLAAHQALGALGFSATRVDIVALTEGDEAGRPVAQPDLDVALSISHSAGWAVAAAAAGTPLGIDIEHLSLAVEPSFSQEAFSAGELDGWRALASTNCIALAWAAKEAALKLLGTGLRSPLLQVRVEAIDISSLPLASYALRVGIHRKGALRLEVDGYVTLSDDFALVVLG